MVDKGLTFTGILVMILVMAGAWAGWAVFFSAFNANPNYAESVDETTLELFNTSENISYTQLPKYLINPNIFNDLR